MFFQHENRFRYKFFDIVQFSRSCKSSAMRLRTWLFYHGSDFLSSSFFEVFRFLSNLERSRFLGAGRNFRTSIGSFRFTSSRDSEVILLSQRLALKYNTIRRGALQAFFYKFFALFSLLYTSASFLLEISPCFDTRSARLRCAAPPSGRGRCTIYNKKSICCLHRANGCSLIYDSYFWAYTCLRCSVSFIFSL